MSFAQWVSLLVVFAVCTARLAKTAVHDRTTLGSRSFTLHSSPRAFWLVSSLDVVALIASVGLIARAAAQMAVR